MLPERFSLHKNNVPEHHVSEKPIWCHGRAPETHHVADASVNKGFASDGWARGCPGRVGGGGGRPQGREAHRLRGVVWRTPFPTSARHALFLMFSFPTHHLFLACWPTQCLECAGSDFRWVKVEGHSHNTEAVAIRVLSEFQRRHFANMFF